MTKFKFTAKPLRSVIATLSVAIMLSACAKEDFGKDQLETDQTELVKKLENPYSVANMRKAYAAMSPKTRAAAEINAEDIVATHLYVKFMPKTEDEEGWLLSDHTLTLFPYPLDYEIANPSEYVDPSIPEGMPPYYYASVEVGKALPKDVEWEILEELYIPDEYDEDDEPVINTRASYSLDESFIESLVDEALALTGNEDPQTGGMTRGRSSWRPAGYITYYDDAAGRTIGLEGVEVKARRWFTTHKGYADAITGYYSCDGTFKRPANYSFNLERYDFHIKGEGVKTDFDGPKKTGNWDFGFRRSTNKTEYFGATAFRAAYHYYYKNIGGLRRPPQNSFWRTQMKLKVFNERNDDNNGNFDSARRFLGGNMIKLYNPDNNTIQLYSTAIHELAHAAHWRMIVNEPGTNRVRDFHGAEDKMVESWASGVQWYLTKMVYNTYRGRVYSSTYPNYTNVVIDMLDTETDRTTNNGHSAAQGDNVSGYTINQIESALIGCDSWIKWRNKIKNDYNNATENNLDALFATW